MNPWIQLFLSFLKFEFHNIRNVHNWCKIYLIDTFIFFLFTIKYIFQFWSKLTSFYVSKKNKLWVRLKSWRRKVELKYVFEIDFNLIILHLSRVRTRIESQLCAIGFRLFDIELSFWQHNFDSWKIQLQLIYNVRFPKVKMY